MASIIDIGGGEFYTIQSTPYLLHIAIRKNKHEYRETFRSPIIGKKYVHSPEFVASLLSAESQNSERVIRQITSVGDALTFDVYLLDGAFISDEIHLPIPLAQ